MTNKNSFEINANTDNSNPLENFASQQIPSSKDLNIDPAPEVDLEISDVVIPDSNTLRSANEGDSWKNFENGTGPYPWHLV